MSLFLKLFLSMFISIIVSFSIYSLTIIHMEKRVTDENLLTKIYYNEKVYTSSISVLLYEVNKEVLISLLNSIFLDKEIVKIELDDNAKLLNMNLSKAKYDEKYLIKSSIKLIYENEDLGDLTIYYTNKFINDSIKQYKINIFIFSIILIFILVLILFYFINKFSDSIKILTEASSEIALGNLSREIHIKTKDEIGILANKFEMMRNSLKERIETNEKQAKEIKDLNEDLQHKVYERTIELEKTNKELHNSIENLELTQKQLIESEKMASLGSLVAGISHEINTPVGVCVTASTHFSELTKNLKKDYENDSISEESFEKYINNSTEVAKLIETNLNKTAKLVKSFKQISVDQISEQRRKFDVKKYIYEILFSISNITRKTNLKIDVVGDELEIDTYAGAFSQIITNLIINSVIHGFDKNKDGNIIIDLKNIDNNLFIVYKDNGKGISPENLPKIFDPFFTTNREQGGTGLGMNIIYNIITSKLNGIIVCKSSPNSGVEFTIKIPIS